LTFNDVNDAFVATIYIWSLPV